MVLIQERQGSFQMEQLKLSESKCISGADHIERFDPDSGETACSICGEVLNTYNIVSDAQLNFEDDYGKDKSQHQAVNYRMGKKGLGSTFDNKTSVGKKLRYAQRFVRINDNNETKGLLEFSKCSDKLGLPEFIVQEAIDLFNNVRKKGFLRGHEILATVAACCYLAIRKNGLSISLKEICQKSVVNQKTVYAFYNVMCNKFGIDSTKLMPPKPSDFISGLLNKCNFDIKTRKKCMNTVTDIERIGFHVGKHPKAVAAVAIYVACMTSRYEFTQRKASVISGVSDVTIRNIYSKYILAKKDSEKD